MRPALLLLCFFTVSLFAADAVSDGAKVHYESYGTGKDAIVFIHGWTCDLTFWRGQAPLYEKQRSLLVDLPGHGQSEKPEAAYTMERFARGVDAAMREAGVERAVLVGHSMGTPVMLTFARLFPAKVKGMVIVDGFVAEEPKDAAERTANDARMKPFLEQFKGPNAKQTATMMIASMFSDKTTPAMRDEIRNKMLATPQHVMASAMEGMFGMKPIQKGETFKAPAMAIMAAKRPGYEEKLRATFPNFKKYETWEGNGHFLMMESPERFNKSLEEFVKGL